VTATYDGDGKRRSYAGSDVLHHFLEDGENIARQTDVNGATDRNYRLAQLRCLLASEASSV
jgi:hypothetical protein